MIDNNKAITMIVVIALNADDNRLFFIHAIGPAVDTGAGLAGFAINSFIIRSIP